MMVYAHPMIRDLFEYPIPLGQNILPRQSTSFSNPQLKIVVFVPRLMNEMISPNYNALISWDFVSTIPDLLWYPGFYGFDWNYP